MLKTPNSIDLSKLFFWIFLISIFTFRIPNFYILPVLPSSFLTIQAIARTLMTFIFLYNIFSAFITNTSLFKKTNHQYIFLLILFLFVIQSVSIVSTQNVSAFLSRYKDIILGILSCFNFYFYREQYKIITAVLILALPINFLYQLLMILNNNLFVTLFQPLIYSKHFEVVLINLARSRTYIETYDEIIIPLLFVYFHDKFNYLSISNLLIAFLAFISNWRIRVAMFIVAFISSFLFLFKQKFSLLKIFFIFISLVVISYAVDSLLLSRSGFSFYDRILLTEESDVQTITSRFDQIQIGFDLAKNNILGVGLGNYYDHLPQSHKINMNINSLAERQGEIANEYIHNYFGLLAAESGFISLFVFIILLFIFITSDLNIMFKSKNQYKKAFVISFWTLFLFAMLNPLVPGSSQVLFWGIRGLLID
ncbi:MAG TPA: O-antigen ligase family protein [Candidatus Woesebacteria bacterium]|nr:O-antigen ligase family protein [Candidatus Woesebacteria bacterium]